MLAEEPLDLAADRGLGRLAVGPVDRQVGADALDEVARDLGELRVDVALVGAAGERVVERCLLDGQTELLVTATGVAQALGDLDEPLDDLGARDLPQLVAVQDRVDLLGEKLGLRLVGACGGCGFRP